MIIKEIKLAKRFIKQFQKLPLEVRVKARKASALLQKNPFHPSIRLHKLKGRLQGAWSISLDRKYRIIFKPREDGSVMFADIGKHSIYEES